MADEGWRQQRAQELWGDSEPWFIRESRRRTWSTQNDDAPLDDAAPDAAGQGAPAGPEERRPPSLKLVRDEPPAAEPERHDPVPPAPAVAKLDDDWRALRAPAGTDGESWSIAAATVPPSSDAWRIEREAPVAAGSRPAVGIQLLPDPAPAATAGPRPQPAVAARSKRLLWLAAAVLLAALTAFTLGWLHGTSAPTLPTEVPPAVQPRQVTTLRQAPSSPQPTYVPTLEPAEQAPDLSQPRTDTPARDASTRSEASPAAAETSVTSKRAADVAQALQPKAKAPPKQAKPAVVPSRSARGTGGEVAVEHRPEPRTIIIPPEPEGRLRPDPEVFPTPSERSRAVADDSAVTAQLNAEQAEVARSDDEAEPALRPRRRFWDTSRLPICTGFQVYRPTTPCRVAPRR